MAMEVCIWAYIYIYIHMCIREGLHLSLREGGNPIHALVQVYAFMYPYVHVYYICTYKSWCVYICMSPPFPQRKVNPLFSFFVFFVFSVFSPCFWCFPCFPRFLCFPCFLCFSCFRKSLAGRGPTSPWGHVLRQVHMHAYTYTCVGIEIVMVFLCFCWFSYENAICLKPGVGGAWF